MRGCSAFPRFTSLAPPPPLLSTSLICWRFKKKIALLLQGFIVRGLVLMNPHNPLADIYTPKEMVSFLEFAKRYSDFRPRCNSATCRSTKGYLQKHSLRFHRASSHFDQDSCPMCGILSTLNDFLLPVLILSILAQVATCH